MAPRQPIPGANRGRARRPGIRRAAVPWSCTGAVTLTEARVGIQPQPRVRRDALIPADSEHRDMKGRSIPGATADRPVIPPPRADGLYAPSMPEGLSTSEVGKEIGEHAKQANVHEAGATGSS